MTDGPVNKQLKQTYLCFTINKKKKKYIQGPEKQIINKQLFLACKRVAFGQLPQKMCRCGT